MDNMILAYDLGTGGIKASLFDIHGHSYGDSFYSYNLYCASNSIHEQCPEDWWNGIVQSTHRLLKKAAVDAGRVVGMSFSGHSLSMVPIDREGNLLMDRIPIWSDTRAEKEAEEYFEAADFDYEEWYEQTGNGFPVACYTIFKIMWLKKNHPEIFEKTYKILGSKDYCNYKLTGVIKTDHSYASGSGVYHLRDRDYKEELLAPSNISRSLLPDIIEAHEVVGTLLPEVAKELGLNQNIRVVCGGVDNSCMALGGRGIEEGRIYMSLGSSSWIAVTGWEPITDKKTHPFVFAHVIPGMYASSLSIFAAGSCIRWMRDNLCPDLVELEQEGKLDDAYLEMNRLSLESPIGAKNLFFNSTMAGGTQLDETPDIAAGFVGLNLSHNRKDVLRATMEGVTYGLKTAFEVFRCYNSKITEMLVVGGGSKSEMWRQMFADVFEIDIIKTAVDQEAACLGAAALAAYGLGYWKDYHQIDQIHVAEDIKKPITKNLAAYRKVYALHRKMTHYMAEAGMDIKAE